MLTELFQTLVASFCFALGFLIIKYLTRLGQIIWAWVDDSKAPYWNLVTIQMMKVWGFSYEKDPNFARRKAFRRGDMWESDIGDVVPYTVFSFVAILISGPILYLAWTFYPVTLFILALILVAHLTRFTRRLSKKFKEHTEDKNAHS